MVGPAPQLAALLRRTSSAGVTSRQRPVWGEKLVELPQFEQRMSGSSLARGRFKRAIRRLNRNGVEATLAPGASVLVRYPSVRRLRRVFSPHFEMLSWRGVGVVVPPSYLESLAARVPRMFRLAAAVDPWLGTLIGFRSFADHIVMTFQRTMAGAT